MQNFLIFCILCFSLVGFSQRTQNDKFHGSCQWNIPTAISLNCGDKHSKDYIFRIQCSCSVKEFHLAVYNRWGAKMFESTEMHNYWDASDKKFAKGAYYWTLSGNYLDGIKYQEVGTVTLLK